MVECARERFSNWLREYEYIQVLMQNIMSGLLITLLKKAGNVIWI